MIERLKKRPGVRERSSARGRRKRVKNGNFKFKSDSFSTVETLEMSSLIDSLRGYSSVSREKRGGNSIA